MKKKCFIYQTSSIYKRSVCIDNDIKDEIYDFLSVEANFKKFRYIVNRILEQPFSYYEGYEKLTPTYKSVSEMRIFPNGKNVRIYCKEINTIDGNFYVIAAKFLHKKTTQKIDKELTDSIKPIENYDYEID